MFVYLRKDRKGLISDWLCPSVLERIGQVMGVLGVYMS